jgi:peptidoglycan/xylan/chitin deacetylase (PgdA/CDA1 family)
MGPKVLYYHDVFDSWKYYLHGTPFGLFRKHMEMLFREGWEIKTGLPDKGKECMLTFDDGFKGIWSCREYFYERAIRPTIFVAVDLIGGERYLSWKEIKELQEHGFIFEGHTWTHRRLTEVPRAELQRELKDSRDCLSDRLGKEVTQLCFPQGRFNEDICKIAQDYGYKTFYSCIYGNADRRIIPNLVCRNLVQEVGTITFKAILNGGANPLWRRYYKQHCVPSID